jgi:hypothetical protein
MPHLQCGVPYARHRLLYLSAALREELPDV